MPDGFFLLPSEMWREVQEQTPLSTPAFFVPVGSLFSHFANWGQVGQPSPSNAAPGSHVYCADLCLSAGGHRGWALPFHYQVCSGSQRPSSSSGCFWRLQVEPRTLKTREMGLLRKEALEKVTSHLEIKSRAPGLRSPLMQRRNSVKVGGIAPVYIREFGSSKPEDVTALWAGMAVSRAAGRSVSFLPTKGQMRFTAALSFSPSLNPAGRMASGVRSAPLSHLSRCLLHIQFVPGFQVGSSDRHSVRITGVSNIDFQASFSNQPTFDLNHPEERPVQGISCGPQGMYACMCVGRWSCCL